MVTSNKLVDKKVVKMAEQSSGVVVPQRTLLGEVNAHLTCYLCRGYYIDATTIVECLHSFCRSCIIKHLQIKSYCPVCEMMINSAKPNIKPDKALQDIVYKLVPGLFQREMERRQHFYSSRPGPAASATPEQRGEDTERIIFSPEDVISFSLEYADVTDTDSISSKSSDSNEPQNALVPTRRYLQCPAVVNISHLKKFLSMKFDIDSSQFSIDILYKRVPLPDYYTLMDIAYIFNWKRNEPMRFFYQIIDYIAIRSRYGLFDINRKGSHFRDRKSSPALTEDTNTSSPAPHLNEPGSEGSSGTDSPMPQGGTKNNDDTTKQQDQLESNPLDHQNQDIKVENAASSGVKNDDDVEKSQFLNSFELTAKTNSNTPKTSPSKTDSENMANTSKVSPSNVSPSKCHITPDDSLLKRKLMSNFPLSDNKKIKLEMEKPKCDRDHIKNSRDNVNSTDAVQKVNEITMSTSHTRKNTEPGTEVTGRLHTTTSSGPTSTVTSQTDTKKVTDKDSLNSQLTTFKQHFADQNTLKRPVANPQTGTPPKRKNVLENVMYPPETQKTVSPIKLQVPKTESFTKSADTPKNTLKKIPDLKLNVPSFSLGQQNKQQSINKGVRMDLLANNSDPTIDRSKILSQVKTSLAAQLPGPSSGDPLKSLFDSCKINIPSSLSITLTDQKLDQRSPGDPSNPDIKKPLFNKNNSLGTSGNLPTHIVPSPAVHNYIEILKLPDIDVKKQAKSEGNVSLKTTPTNKSVDSQTKPGNNKTTETPTTKGPMPSLKPITDAKIGKSGNFSKPTTFQQTFLQSLQQSEKTKMSKNKMQVPKLMPATPKSIGLNTCKDSQTTPLTKGTLSNNPVTENKTPSTKSDSVLDLSTPHTVQSQLGPQQTKALETMQSIANLAKKQSLPCKGAPSNITQSSSFAQNRQVNSTAGSPLRIPSNNQVKSDKSASVPVSQSNNVRQEIHPKQYLVKHNNNGNPVSTNYSTVTQSPNTAQPSPNTAQPSPNTAQPSPRLQTRSPSSSPKLVIAEEKQNVAGGSELNANQTNQISSSQISSSGNTVKCDSQKLLPGPSKPINKSFKPLPPIGKLSNIRQPTTSGAKANPTLNMSGGILNSFEPQILAQQYMRQQMEMQWYKMNQARQYENLIKNISNSVHQNQTDFNSKDKQ